MDSLLLFLLLAGTTVDRPASDAPASPPRVQAMASARILRGEAVDFGSSANRPVAPIATQGSSIFRIALIRSFAVIESADGQTIQLQEFQ
ncbi:hypothetical protein [Parasphingorhabdus sp.]|uniref:hypothetical protein n=1 Tax=Parasphingorhabdus sp. TaxID=2709688 RepID=UPI0035945B8B